MLVSGWMCDSAFAASRQSSLIQRILRHANVSTTATYYIKTAADDVRNAMAKLENTIPSASETPQVNRDTLETLGTGSHGVPGSIN
jgi:hypothetical protein